MGAQPIAGYQLEVPRRGNRAARLAVWRSPIGDFEPG
jgi:hypothetical protein